MELKKDKHKQEAMKRLKELDVAQVIMDYLEKDEVLVTRTGELYTLDDELTEDIKKFEENRGHFVYHVIDMDGLVNFLFVSKYEEDWDYESSMIENNIVYAYVYPKDNKLDGEIGPIEVEIDGDIIERIS